MAKVQNTKMQDRFVINLFAEFETWYSESYLTHERERDAAKPTTEQQSKATVVSEGAANEDTQQQPSAHPSTTVVSFLSCTKTVCFLGYLVVISAEVPFGHVTTKCFLFCDVASHYAAGNRHAPRTLSKSTPLPIK